MYPIFNIINMVICKIRQTIKSRILLPYLQKRILEEAEIEKDDP